jgi:hypothetical protein
MARGQAGIWAVSQRTLLDVVLQGRATTQAAYLEVKCAGDSALYTLLFSEDINIYVCEDVYKALS